MINLKEVYYLHLTASTTTLKLPNHKKQHAEKPSKQAFYGTAGYHVLVLSKIRGEQDSLQNPQPPEHPCDSVRAFMLTQYNL